MTCDLCTLRVVVVRRLICKNGHLRHCIATRRTLSLSRPCVIGVVHEAITIGTSNEHFHIMQFNSSLYLQQPFRSFKSVLFPFYYYYRYASYGFFVFLCTKLVILNRIWMRLHNREWKWKLNEYVNMWKRKQKISKLICCMRGCEALELHLSFSSSLSVSLCIQRLQSLNAR